MKGHFIYRLFHPLEDQGDLFITFVRIVVKLLFVRLAVQVASHILNILDHKVATTFRYLFRKYMLMFSMKLFLN